MQINVVSGDITRQQVGAVIVNLFEGVTEPAGAAGAVDAALDGAVSQLIGDGEIRGERGEMTLIHTLGKMVPPRVLVAGLGKASEISTDVVRSVVADSCRRLRRTGVEAVATITHGAGAGGLDARASGRAIAEGGVMGLYRFDKYKTNSEDGRGIRELTIVEFDADKVQDLEEAAAEGAIIGDAVNLCRDLVNEPANYMTPTRMAETALQVAGDCGLEIEVLERRQMAELGMGAILGVAQGSAEPPKLIVLRYRGGASGDSPNLGLLGKGITFDSGGLDIKPPAGMRSMKGDMAGGAAVIAAMKAIGKLKPRLDVTAVVPATENMPGGKAQRPGDVVETMNGKTVEIDNTDAEGRLVLADAAEYAVSNGVDRIVDVATLTGAVTVALGNLCIGAFGNDRTFTNEVIAAGDEAGERIWELPTYGEYKEQYWSDVADIKNAGSGGAGAITGALFIGEFVGDRPWVHLDIAGTRYSDKAKGDMVKGATGVAVRTLVALAAKLSHS